MSKSKEADTPRLCEQMTQGKPKHVLVLVLDLQRKNGCGCIHNCRFHATACAMFYCSTIVVSRLSSHSWFHQRAIKPIQQIQSQLNSFFFSFGERPQFVNLYQQGESVFGEFIGNVVILVLVLKYCFKHISYMDWGQPNMETLKITPILFFPHLWDKSSRRLFCKFQ